MQLQRLHRRQVGIIATAVLLASFYFFIFGINNGLALGPLPNHIDPDTFSWAGHRQGVDNFRYDGFDEPIEDLPTNDTVYFTNTHLTDSFQYAQTGTGSRTESQRLFWREQSTDQWQETTLTEKDILPNDFVTQNGRRLLVAIGGLIAEDRHLYFIDVETGVLEKQFETSEVIISPDGNKLLCRRTPSVSGPHSLFVLDLQDATKTHIITLSDRDPGSGRSFKYQWDKSSNFVEIIGTSSKNPGGFRYFYDHGHNKLYDTSLRSG